VRSGISSAAPGAPAPEEGKAMPNYPWLVGGFNHLEYESQWEGLSHIFWKNKKCLKPPISDL